MQSLIRMFLAAPILLTACGLITEQSVYEGIRANQKVKSDGQATKQLPDYETYKEEREKARR